VFLLLGDGIRPGSFLEKAELVDVVPTLLYALGFPIARDLDGQVLTPAFENSYLARHPLTFVPSYETLAAQAGDS
jgi:arylsulfatase A-like enzyme